MKRIYSRVFTAIAISAIMLIVAACAQNEAPSPGTAGYPQRELPTLFITTAGRPFVDRELWLDSTFTLTGTYEGFEFEGITGSVRGRGNSTWWLGVGKRPLRFTLDEAHSMLDSGYAERNWVLLANHFDNSLLRNFSAYFLGSLLDGMAYAPIARNIHLYVNGVYMGVYMLSDQIEAGPNRVIITADSDPAISEYLIERCMRAPDNGVEHEDFVWVNNLSYEFRFPGSSVRTTAHSDYVQDYFYRVSHAIRDGDWEAIQSLIDVPSFIDFYIVQELYKNIDIAVSSVNMHIRGQGDQRRLYMGPIWDFDLAAGNAYYQASWVWQRPGEYGYSPQGIWVASQHYWFRYLLEVPEFFDAMHERWIEASNNQIPHMIQHLLYTATTYRAAFERNFERHNVLGMFTWPNPPEVAEIDTFMGQVDYLVNFLQTRTDWLSAHFAGIAESR